MLQCELEWHVRAATAERRARLGCESESDGGAIDRHSRAHTSASHRETRVWHHRCHPAPWGKRGAAAHRGGRRGNASRGEARRDERRRAASDMQQCSLANLHCFHSSHLLHLLSPLPVSVASNSSDLPFVVDWPVAADFSAPRLPRSDDECITPAHRCAHGACTCSLADDAAAHAARQ